MRKLSTIGIRLALSFLICFLGTYTHAQPTAMDAEQQLESKQYDAAILSYTSLIEKADDEYATVLHFNRALAYYYSQQYDSAEADLNRSIILDEPCPHCNEAIYIAALIQEKKGNWREALSMYEEIQEHIPDYKDVNKRIKKYHLSVWVSKYWYYMIAMALITFIVIALLSSVLSSKRS